MSSVCALESVFPCCGRSLVACAPRCQPLSLPCLYRIWDETCGLCRVTVPTSLISLPRDSEVPAYPEPVL